jgi:hypothetical protein
MKQTKKQALIEQFVQAGLKFFTAMLCWQFVVGPVMGIHITWGENFEITLIMFANSIFFGYWIRRGFDWHHHKDALTKADSRHSTRGWTSESRYWK